MYTLTSSQKDLLRRIVRQVREEKLPEEFSITWRSEGKGFVSVWKGGSEEDIPTVTQGALDALAAAGLLLCDIEYYTAHSIKTELSRTCTLLGKAYEAVDSDFNAPDTSFVKHLTPLADITNLDAQLKQRCLPLLVAGSTDPKLWDSVVRTAGVILEKRLRDVGGIDDPNRVGRDLVNDIFGSKGTLTARISNDSERQGYRDIYAGIVGAFRNPYAHRLVDPTPEDGGAFIIFINLLLKMLEDLR